MKAKFEVVETLCLIDFTDPVHKAACRNTEHEHAYITHHSPDGLQENFQHIFLLMHQSEKQVSSFRDTFHVVYWSGRWRRQLPMFWSPPDGFPTVSQTILSRNTVELMVLTPASAVDKLWPRRSVFLKLHPSFYQICSLFLQSCDYMCAVFSTHSHPQVVTRWRLGQGSTTLKEPIEEVSHRLQPSGSHTVFREIRQ